MTNADQKAAIRERMASTGENYTTARRAIELAGLKAQSEQLDSTLAERRTRILNERFDTVAEQLGSDKSAAVRLAAVYAMAGLADDWQDHRQTCVDVLCAYLRMPYEPEPGDDAPVEKRLAWQASREVRHTVIRVIAAHLNGTAPVSWCGLNFDFAGAVFDGGDFSAAKFSGGTVNFVGAEFSGGTVNFAGAEFSGGTVDFSRVASWTQPPDFGSGFDMSHPPAGVMPPTATSPSPDSPIP
jgi:Pentapeptide repeats (9 copies)